MTMTNIYTGAHGSLVVGSSASTPEGADGQAIQDAYGLTEVGRVTDVTLRVDARLEAFHEVGRRHPVSLHHGNVGISGTIGRAYVNGALLYLLMGRGALPTTQAEPYQTPQVNLVLRLNDPALPGTSAAIDVFSVKFESWAMEVPEDEFVMEDVAFKALSINVIDAEAPAGGGEPTPIAVAFPELGA
jgi:hypothetical protein